MLRGSTQKQSTHRRFVDDCLLTLRGCFLQANRRAWADLVHYARVNGGDEECSAGRSFRYGVGVSFAQHASYLASMGLAPEREPSGAWIGYDPAKVEPLEDEEHPFFAHAAASAAAAAEQESAAAAAAPVAAQ